MLGISRTQVVRRVQTGALRPFAKLESSRGVYIFDRNDIEREAKK